MIGDVCRRRRLLKANQPVPRGEVPYVGTDGRFVDRSRTPTSGRRFLKDGGPVYRGSAGRSSTTMMCGPGQVPGQPCGTGDSFETTPAQYCDHSKHWHRTTAVHPPLDVALRYTQQRSDYSAAAGDHRNYFYDGTENDDLTTFVDWGSTGNDAMTLSRCYGDASSGSVANEHVYEMAA